VALFIVVSALHHPNLLDQAITIVLALAVANTYISPIDVPAIQLP